VENVWAVPVDQDAVFIEKVVCIAADMRPFIHEHYTLVKPRRQAFSQDAPGKPSAYDEIVEHVNTPLNIEYRRNLTIKAADAAA
jgi:hypothetical protein